MYNDNIFIGDRSMQEIYFLVIHAGAIQREPASPSLVSTRNQSQKPLETIKDFEIENNN